MATAPASDIYCNICDNMITGTRFHCTVCEDYDLCGKCHALGLHSEATTGHPLEQSGPEETVSIRELQEHEQALLEEHSALFGNVDESVCTAATATPRARQPLFVCRTCVDTTQQAVAVCLACSLACHPEHDLVELYTKRNFVCECGTGPLLPDHPCTLLPDRVRAETNKHGQNFHGRFCTCHKPYDPASHDGDMSQCVLCEDWFHTERRDEEHSAVVGHEAEDHDFVCADCLDRCPFLLDYLGVPAAPAATSPLAGCLRPRTQDAPTPPALVSDTAPATVADPAASSAAASGPSVITADGPSVPAADGSTPAALAPAAPNAPIPASDPARAAAAAPTLSRRAAYLPRLHTTVCFCAVCVALYKVHDILFLCDPGDSLAAFKQRGEQAVATRSAEEIQSMDRMISVMPHEAQVALARSIGEFRTEFAEFIASIPPDEMVTGEQIREHFAAAAKRRRTE